MESDPRHRLRLPFGTHSRILVAISALALFGFQGDGIAQDHSPTAITPKSSRSLDSFLTTSDGKYLVMDQGGLVSLWNVQNRVKIWEDAKPRVFRVHLGMDESQQAFIVSTGGTQAGNFPNTKLEFRSLKDGKLLWQDTISCAGPAIVQMSADNRKLLLQPIRITPGMV
jgi:hypothetical protein